jgi:hypothetical protein
MPYHYRGLKKLDPWDLHSYESITENYFNPYTQVFECLIPEYSDKAFYIRPDLVGYSDGRLPRVHIEIKQNLDRCVIAYDKYYRLWQSRRFYEGICQEVYQHESLDQVFLMNGAYFAVWPLIVAAIMRSVGYRASGLNLKITPRAQFPKLPDEDDHDN